MKRGDLETSLIEISRNPLVELADELSGEAEMRKKEEGDAGPFIERLVQFLQDKDHALIGGLGVRAHVRERPTLDFDAMIQGGHWGEMRAEQVEYSLPVESAYLCTFRSFLQKHRPNDLEYLNCRERVSPEKSQRAFCVAMSFNPDYNDVIMSQQQERRKALEAYALWQRSHPVRREYSDVIADLGVLREWLPEPVRLRCEDPGKEGVRHMHGLLKNL